MTLSDQTTTDLHAMIEIVDQRLHEMTGTPEAVNTYDPAEVATIYDLRDYLGGLVAD
jgi:hypothetical protein